jgi:outer membrane protein assembly factor BamB
MKLQPLLAPTVVGIVVLCGPVTGQPARQTNWPAFRGPEAAGIAGSQNLPEKWNAATGENILWQVTIPGLAHSSPIVWGDRIYVTSAISSKADAAFKPGLYGEGTASEDRTPHKWVVVAFDRKTGKQIWQSIAYEGVPREKRHIKSTYASSTPATDGRYIAAFFASQGLYVFDMKGKEVWKKDLGHLDAGAYDVPDLEWGNASSPIIYKDLVIVQCDTQKESFVLASDIKTGKQIWKADRKELPSWATPTVYVPPAGGRSVLVTNSPNFIRGYDPDTGAEIWRLGGSSKITAPTPIFSRDLIIVASGRRPEKPLFAIRPDARGDITLPDGQEASQSIAWSKRGRGSYMPTPVIVDDILYVLNNDGLFDAYELKSGAEIYRQRIPHKGSGFSGSPVASDGRIILSSEDGEMFVIRSGRQFEVIATNPMGESLMATPAIAGGMMYVRGVKKLFAVGRK